VWRLQLAAEHQAGQRGIRLHTAFAESRQPEVGRTLNTLLEAHPDATGLLLNHEAPAAALPGPLAARSLSAPDDLSVLRRYSDEFARTFSSPYSSIESAPDRLSSMAVRNLVRRIGAGSPDAPHVVGPISPELVDRGSTGAPGRRVRA
jgi:DNA-binding LacI/PurR family transcriptional regulator